jgi:hypothetical protein
VSAKPGPPAIEILEPERVDRPAIDDLLRLAQLLDNQFVVPGTNFRFGIDSIIGLIPGIGDAVSALISLYIMARAKHLGAPNGLLVKMGINVAIDTTIGAFPIFGDLFDAAFKSNLKNVRLLLDHVSRGAKVRDPAA